MPIVTTGNSLIAYRAGENHEGWICQMLDPAFFHNLQIDVAQIGSTVIFSLYVYRHCAEVFRKSFRRPRRRKKLEDA
jgi:hypothetical protein